MEQEAISGEKLTVEIGMVRIIPGVYYRDRDAWRAGTDISPLGRHDLCEVPLSSEIGVTGEEGC